MNRKEKFRRLYKNIVNAERCHIDIERMEGVDYIEKYTTGNDRAYIVLYVDYTGCGLDEIIIHTKEIVVASQCDNNVDRIIGLLKRNGLEHLTEGID